jgi:hypothetical protein
MVAVPNEVEVNNPVIGLIVPATPEALQLPPPGLLDNEVDCPSHIDKAPEKIDGSGFTVMVRTIIVPQDEG